MGRRPAGLSAPTLHFPCDLSPARFRMERYGLAFGDFVDAVRTGKFQFKRRQPIGGPANDGADDAAAFLAFHAERKTHLAALAVGLPNALYIGTGKSAAMLQRATRRAGLP